MSYTPQNAWDRSQQTGLASNPGPFLAEVMKNNDPLYSGRLLVYIPDFGGDPAEESSWHLVRYMSPYYGIQPLSNRISADPADPNQVESYGMWMQPPDLGVKVLVMFINGDRSRGVWIGCLPEIGSHAAIPGNDRGDFDVFANQAQANVDIKSISRPEHSTAPTFEAQGLQNDSQRGYPITTSSLRESPARVFGFNTPGGHSFFMDDGDAENGNNKMYRLRTAAGNMIMLNDDNGFVYVINAKGTGWVELSPNGFVDIYGEAGVSIATKGSIDLHADQNINMHANQDIKIVANNELKLQGTEKAKVFAKDLYLEGVDSIHIHSCGIIRLTANKGFQFKSNGNYTLQGRIFRWNSGNALEAEQVFPERDQEITGYRSTVNRAPNREPWPGHDEQYEPDPLSASIPSPAEFSTGNIVSGVLTSTQISQIDSGETVKLPDGTFVTKRTIATPAGNQTVYDRTRLIDTPAGPQQVAVESSTTLNSIFSSTATPGVTSAFEQPIQDNQNEISFKNTGTPAVQRLTTDLNDIQSRVDPIDVSRQSIKINETLLNNAISIGNSFSTVNQTDVLAAPLTSLSGLLGSVSSTGRSGLIGIDTKTILPDIARQNLNVDLTTSILPESLSNPLAQAGSVINSISTLSSVVPNIPGVSDILNVSNALNVLNIPGIAPSIPGISDIITGVPINIPTNLSSFIPPDIGNAIADASGALSNIFPQQASSAIPGVPGGGVAPSSAVGNNCEVPKPVKPSSDTPSEDVDGNALTGAPGNIVPPNKLTNDPAWQAELAKLKQKFPSLSEQDLYRVVQGESGFNSTIVNANSGATGLFQFIPSTAKDLGYTTAEIQRMTPAQQLNVYGQYLERNNYRGGPLGIMQAAPGTYSNLVRRYGSYEAVPRNIEIYKQGSKAWIQNPGWRGPDGRITIESINNYYNKQS